MNMRFATKKKSVTFGLASVFAASMLLAACGSGGNNQSASNASPSSSASASPDSSGTAASPSASAASASPSPDLKPYNITMFIPAAAAPKDLDEVNKAISDYLKPKINATFELSVIDWGSWQDKMNLKIASNESFDLMWTTDWDNYTTRVQSGAFLPLDDLVDQYGQDIKKVVPQSLFDGGRASDGKFYGVPVWKEIGTQKGVMLRKDLVDKYHFDVSTVKKPEDLEPFFEVIKKNEPGVTPFYSNESVNLWYMVSANDFDGVGGTDVVDRNTTDFKVFNQFADPRAKEILDLTRKWYQAGYINKDAATLQDIAGGIKAGKAFAYEEYMKPGKDAELEQQTGLQWVPVNFTPVYVGTADSKGNMMSISRNAKDPARDMMFLNLLYTDKTLLNMLAFGIEGKHYVKKSDNVIDFPDGVNAQTSGYNLGEAYMFGNQFNDYLWANEDPQKWEKFKDYNASAIPSKIIGFQLNTEPVKTELAVIGNVIKEFTPGLYTGSVDPNDVLPKFLAKLKASGSDKVDAELQKQIDDFVSKKK